VFKYNLSITVCDKALAVALNNKARILGKKARVHIKVDTGMGRIGVLEPDAEDLIKYISKLKFVRIEGLFTHFAFADMNEDFTVGQINLFNNLIQRLKKININIPFIHAANSMGVIGYKNSHFNMVRPGLVIYGLYPRKDLRINLKPVLSLKTKILFIKNLPKGCGISYGHEYVTPKATRVATLPIGYGDGYPRNLSNRAQVLISGKKFPICGRICMDQIMVDIGGCAAKVGDEVVLIGTQGKNTITAQDLAELAGTISYEIVCGLGTRIPRVYI
jgi:alanine racemase